MAIQQVQQASLVVLISLLPAELKRVAKELKQEPPCPACHMQKGEPSALAGCPGCSPIKASNLVSLRGRCCLWLHLNSGRYLLLAVKRRCG